MAQAYDAKTRWRRYNRQCVCHSRSENLKKECLEADTIIAAIGRPDFVTADMVKEGATVIDVGTTRVPDATQKHGFRLNGAMSFRRAVAPLSSLIHHPWFRRRDP